MPRRGDPLRRALLLLMGAVFGVLISPLSAATGPRLYVFANADMRARTLEKTLEANMVGVEVTVFSRFREFESAMRDNPEGVLARAPVLRSLGRSVDLQGYRGEKSEEAYVLMAANREVRVGDLAGQMIGAVDLVGRRNMSGFLSHILGQSAPRAKYVTHQRDLLALLQFNAVTAVVISERWAGLLKSKSEMNLRTTPLPGDVGLAAVSFSSNGRAQLESKIKAAGGGFDEALGVTRWR